MQQAQQHQTYGKEPECLRLGDGHDFSRVKVQAADLSLRHWYGDRRDASLRFTGGTQCCVKLDSEKLIPAIVKALVSLIDQGRAALDPLPAQSGNAWNQLWFCISGLCSHTSPVLLSRTAAPLKFVKTVKRESLGRFLSQLVV